MDLQKAVSSELVRRKNIKTIQLDAIEKETKAKEKAWSQLHHAVVDTMKDRNSKLYAALTKNILNGVDRIGIQCTAAFPDIP